MTETIVKIFFLLIAIYLCAGVIFSLFFIKKGIKIIDPDGTHGSSAGFKIIIIPGVIVLWAVLLEKWLKTLKNK